MSIKFSRKAMRRYCKDTNWSESSGSRVECGDVTIFSQDNFYPINWRQWFWLYKVSILTTKSFVRISII